MDTQPLIDAGLTEVQALAYTCLIEHSPITPPNLSQLISETRTNTYKILEQLEEIGLAKREDIAKKIHYWALNPQGLLGIAQEAEEQAQHNRRRLEASLPALVNAFLEHNEQPGVRFYPGEEGVASIYQHMLEKSADIEMIHVNAAYSGKHTIEELHTLRNRLSQAGIERHIFCADADYYDLPEDDRMPTAESDKLMNLSRTWLKDGEYTSPVEWSVYGNSVAIISYGEESMGMIIESEPIAESLRQLMGIMQKDIESRPGYDSLPEHHKFTKIPEVAKSK